MEKTFTYAGVAQHRNKYKGQFRVMFANSADRVPHLIKHNYYNIDIIQLKHPMTKCQAIEYLLAINFSNDEQILQCLHDTLAKRPTAKVSTNLQNADDWLQQVDALINSASTA